MMDEDPNLSLIIWALQIVFHILYAYQVASIIVRFSLQSKQANSLTD